MQSVLLDHARTLSLAGLLAISALLSACGGGGGGSAQITPNTSNPPGTTTTLPVTPTTGTGTGTVTSLDSAPDSSIYDTAANNTCVNVQDTEFPEDITNSTLAEYEFSGRALDNTVGDGTLTVVKTNMPKDSFDKTGPHYKRNTETTELIKDIAVDPGSLSQLRLTTIKSKSYYVLGNPGLPNQRFGLVGINVFQNISDADSLITSTSYMPTFYDRIFALAPGQSMLQSENSTVTTIGQATQSVVITKRISYIAQEAINVGSKPYETCKYEVRRLAPQDNLVTIEWYLKGTGTLFKSETKTTAGVPVRDVRLVRLLSNGFSLFPR
jgi:hypothetical protein